MNDTASPVSPVRSSDPDRVSATIKITRARPLPAALPLAARAPLEPEGLPCGAAARTAVRIRLKSQVQTADPGREHIP